MAKNIKYLRIIAGIWRGRHIKFTADRHLRPTTDFIRETLFNWLMPYIAGTRCLDCFTGSGALGFEALSRGAAHVTMIDRSPQACSDLKENAATLGILESDTLAIYHKKFPFKDESWQPFDIVFLDPPFAKNLIEPNCAFLETANLIKNGSLIYVEAERALKALPTPPSWRLLKSKIQGQVGYHLFIKET